MIIAFSFWQSGVNVLKARDAYFRSVDSKKDALYFIHLTESVREDTLPLLVCYKGAAEMIKAKNAINPISKLTFFKRGKSLIERSIARDTASIECHFIRYTIQDNLPSFLDYSRNIRQDSIMITAGIDQITDVDLKNKITGYLNHLKTKGKYKN